VPCFEDQILEYATGNLSEQEADRVRGHIKYCPKCHAYYLGLLKTEAEFITWNVSSSFGDVFDKELIIACEDRLEVRDLIHDILKPSLKYFYAAACVLALLGLYRYAIFNESAAVFNRLSSTQISAQVGEKDLKLYLGQCLIGELGRENPNLCTLATLDMAINLPATAPAQQRVEDLKLLLNESASAARKRFFVFDALDWAFIYCEGIFRRKSEKLPEVNPGKVFLQASVDMESQEWDKASEGFKAALLSPSGPEEAASAAFRLGFVSDITGDYSGADGYYELTKKKYPGSLEALLAGEMAKYSGERRKYASLVETEAARIRRGKENAGTFYILGSDRMLHLDLDRAAEDYTKVIIRFYGKNKRHSKVNLAWCFKAKGDYKNAIDLYGSFRLLDLDHRIYGDFEKSLSFAELGDIESARQALSWEAKREFPGAYKVLARNYFQQKRSY